MRIVVITKGTNCLYGTNVKTQLSYIHVVYTRRCCSSLTSVIIVSPDERDARDGLSDRMSYWRIYKESDHITLSDMFSAFLFCSVTYATHYSSFPSCLMFPYLHSSRVCALA
jgi:hypothetical protein